MWYLSHCLEWRRSVPPSPYLDHFISNGKSGQEKPRKENKKQCLCLFLPPANSFSKQRSLSHSPSSCPPSSFNCIRVTLLSLRTSVLFSSRPRERLMTFVSQILPRHRFFPRLFVTWLLYSYFSPTFAPSYRSTCVTDKGKMASLTSPPTKEQLHLSSGIKCVASFQPRTRRHEGD